MRFSVGDVANILNITPSALRFYEQKKIIHTKKTESGRRYYDLNDIVRLLSYKKYSSMEMSVNTIVKQFDENIRDSRHIIKSRLDQKAAEAMEKSRYYQKLAETIREQAENVRAIDDNLGKFTVFQRPEYFVLTHGSTQLMPSSQAEEGIVQQWIRQIPDTRVTFVRGDLSEGDLSDTALGYVISGVKAREAGIITASPNIIHLPSVPAIRSFYAVDNAVLNPAEIFYPLMEYIKQKPVTAGQYPLAIFSVVESIGRTHYRAYLDVSVPFGL